MEEQAKQLSSRFLKYSVAILDICAELNKSPIESHISGQLMRSATSVGANYEEACGAQSRADFIHKLQVVFKEARESLYWLKLIQASPHLEAANIDHMIDETSQLNNILAKSIKTAKSRRG